MLKSGASCYIPLVVSVTGNRDIDPGHDDAILEQICNQLKMFDVTYTNTPIRCLGCLADGADMLFATAALRLGYEFSAVLPAHPDDFEKYFDRPAHASRNSKQLRESFRSILLQCKDVIVIGDTRPTDANRYIRVGRYLAQHSHVLLAVWDGDDGAGECCAADIVKMFRDDAAHRDRRSPSKAFITSEPQPVFQLPVGATSKQQVNSLHWLPICQDDQEIKHRDRMFAALEGYNAAVTEMIRKDPGFPAQNAQEVLGTDDLTNQERRILSVYSAADSMAVHYQVKARNTLKAMFFTMWLMVLCFASYAHLLKNPAMLVAYLVLFGGGCIVFIIGHVSNIYVKYLDYRGLAEGLRVQMYYSLSGLKTVVTEHYMRKHQSELAWIRDAIRTLCYGDCRDTPCQDLVVEKWVDAQAQYFSDKYKENRGKFRKHEIIAAALFVIGVVIALCVVVDEYYFKYVLHNHDAKDVIIVLMEMLPATAAALTGYAYRLGLDQQVKQYSRMNEIYRKAKIAFGEASARTDAHEFQDLVQELGKEALAENGDWILLPRDRPIPLPLGA